MNRSTSHMPLGTTVEIGIRTDANLAHRTENQDAVMMVEGVAIRHDGGDRHAVVAVVADGAGGEGDGAGAAARVAQVAPVCLPGILAAVDLDQVPEILQAVVEETNRRMFAERRGRQRSASTLAMVAILQDQWLGGRAWVAGAGDSLVHVGIGDLPLERVHSPHRAIQPLIDSGNLSEADAQVHPDASVITSALGAFATIPQLDITAIPLAGSARFVISTDGVWGQLTRDQIDEFTQDSDPQAAADRLVREALAPTGADDNTTAVVVFINRRPHPSGNGGQPE